MNRTFCNICSAEIETEKDSAMQARAGDFGAEVTTADGSTVKIGVMITTDGVVGASGFDICIACWNAIAPRFVTTPSEPTARELRQRELVQRLDADHRAPHWLDLPPMPPPPPFGGGVQPLGPIGFLCLCAALTAAGLALYRWLT